MSVVGEMIGASHQFEHRGKTYKVSLITQEVKDAFEKKMFAHAKDTAKNIKDIMTQGEYEAHVEKIRNDYMDGKFSLETERGLEFIQSSGGKGGKVLVSLLFGVDEHEALCLMAERSEDITSLLKTIFVESYPMLEGKLEEDGEQKNVPSPAPAGRGSRRSTPRS